MPKRYFGPYGLLLLLLCSLVVVCPVQAAPATSGEVVVSATRTEQELFDVASSAAVVNARTLEREPHTTIAEALQDIPGVQVADGGMGGGVKRVTIRGESGSQVLILVDGMKISEQKSMDGSMVLISPANIERIEVIKGPASVLYGSEAIGGVVNIITKKGGSKPMQGQFITTYDSSNNSFTPNAALYGSYKGFSYRFSGDYTDAGNKRGGSGTIPHTEYRQRNGSAYLDYAWEGGRAGAGYDAYSADINVPAAMSDGALVQPDLPKWARERLYVFTELTALSDTLQKMKLTVFTQETQKDFGNQIDVHQVVGNVMGKDLTVDVNTSLMTKNTQRSYGATLQTDWTFGDSHYVIGGIEYLRDNLDADEIRNGTQTVTMPPFFRPVTSQNAGNGTYHIKGYQETWAVFAQDEWSLAQDWTATLGLRHSWVRSGLDHTNDSKLRTGSDSDSKLTASAGLVYSGVENWRFRGQYAQGYKYPLLQQLYIGTVHGSADITNPNPNLKPETSHSFELGARYQAHGVTADLAVYYTLSDDYVYRALGNLNGATVYMFDNSNSARTYGSELLLSYLYEPWNLTPYLSATYMHRELDRGPRNGGKTTATGDPRFYGRVGLRYEQQLSPVVGFHADAFMRMAASADEADTTGQIARYPGWATANLAFGFRFGEEQNYFLNVNLNNLTNKTYTPAASSIEDPGLSAVVAVGMEF